MKKFLLSLVALIAIGANAWADGITVPNVEVRQGKSGVLSVYLNVDSKKNYGSFAVDVLIPEGFACETMTFKQEVDEGVFEDKEGPKAVLDDAISAFSVASSYPDESNTNFIRVVAFGVGTYINYAENGEFHLCDIPLNQEAEMDVNTEKEGTISNIHLGLSSGEDVSFSDVNYVIKVVEDRIIFAEDSETLPTYTAGEKANVRMNRTIKADIWNTIVLPFTLTQAKAKTAFGDDVQLAEFTSFVPEFADEEDVSPDAITLNFTTYTMTAKKGMTGGKLYLIKTSADIESFDADEVSMVSNVTDVTTTDEFDKGGKFTGSFVKTTVPADGLFLSGNNFYYSTGKTLIKAFRGWFELEEVLGKDTDFGVKLVVDGLPTNISDMQFVNANGAIYTIDGKKMNNDVNRLPKGIYIIDGKKVAIK